MRFMMIAVIIPGVIVLSPYAAQAQDQDVIIDVCGPPIIEQYLNGEDIPTFLCCDEFPNPQYCPSGGDAPVGGEPGVILQNLPSADVEPDVGADTSAPTPSETSPGEGDHPGSSGAVYASTYAATDSVAAAGEYTELPDTGGFPAVAVVSVTLWMAVSAVAFMVMSPFRDS